MIAVNDLINASGNDKPHLLTMLIPEIEELEEKTNDTYNEIKRWMDAFVGQNVNNLATFVRNTLHIPLTQHSGLTANENSLLRILFQLSNYGLFLKKLETDSASVDSGTTLRELRLKIMQVACTLRRLLKPVSDTDIKTFAMHDLVNHTISLTNQQSGVKRLVCCIAVSSMRHTFTRIEVSVPEESVILHSNV